MPDFLTPQALAAAGPLVIETLFKHFISHKALMKDSKARGDDLMYDEAFVLMKTFLEISTKHPVAALQRFGLVRTPAPPWVALHRVIIPQSTLVPAAEYLVEALGGPEMAYKVAGGSKWWQVRAGPGVEAEWIVMKKDWKEYTKAQEEKKRSQVDLRDTAEEHDGVRYKAREESGDGLVGEDGGVGENGAFRQEMDELRCMLYIHGGAYYWGSINTHRYTIWRYARKMHGRCFAVNYRKAPQYPFPCGIQDCLAAYLYLINPPPGAKHHPVHPRNIVIAGDSAGGGLVLALLQILRDTPGLELPAGAVLISPWSDLTHSFPSILQNTATDIVPPYSFIHKPSSLWPPPPPALTEEIQSRVRSRVKEAVARLKEDPQRVHEAEQRVSNLRQQESSLPAVGEPTVVPEELRSSDPDGHGALFGRHKSRDSLHPVTARDDTEAHPEPKGEPRAHPSRANPAEIFDKLVAPDQAVAAGGARLPTTLAQCDIPLELAVEEKKVVIDTQIQLYATNAQLCHPLVSPVLGYLGGLPPLFICAGDNEVLRDEIIFLAHKAAHPDQSPIRDDVRKLLPSLQGIEERHGPTNVHLQVYDGTGHDLPLFSMTRPARGVFRAIASFARYCTPNAPGSLNISRLQLDDSAFAQLGSARSSPWISRRGSPASSGANTPRIPGTPVEPQSHRPLLAEGLTAMPHGSVFVHSPKGSESSSDPAHPARLADSQQDSTEAQTGRLPPLLVEAKSTTSSVKRSGESSSLSRVTFSAESPVELKPTDTEGSGDGENGLGGSKMPTGDDAGPRFGNDPADLDSRAAPGTAGYSGIYRGRNPFKDHMIRERVGTDGTCRPLEPPEELGAMTMPTDEIGMIKEGPAMRYLNGQALWDHKFSHARKQVAKRREKNLKNARNKDARKIVRMWQSRVKKHREDKERRKEMRDEEKVRKRKEVTKAKGARVGGGDGEETDGTTDGDGDGEGEGEGWVSEGDGDGDGFTDQSWSWAWALDGEAPPPSAIVSRRDFTEARQLALMADRMDTSHGSPVHGLSIWVALASFFSSSSDRNRAHEALRTAHEAHKAEKAGKAGKAAHEAQLQEKQPGSDRVGKDLRTGRDRVGNGGDLNAAVMPGQGKSQKHGTWRSVRKRLGIGRTASDKDDDDVRHKE